MSDDADRKSVAGLRDWIRSVESSSPEASAVEDDDLRDLIFFFFLLDCSQCGTLEWFDEVRREVDECDPNRAWEFAIRAVVVARGNGWLASVDDRGYPVAICGECSKKSRPG